jgi:hypothetical protein
MFGHETINISGRVRGAMRRERSWWDRKRIKHRDAVVLCILSAAFLFAGELTVPVLQDVFVEYLLPVANDPVLLTVRALLATFAFTTAFGAVLVLVGGWYFMQGRVGRGRFLVGLGIGLTSLSLVSKLAYATLVYGTPLAFLVPLATSLTGIGMLFGVGAHTAMSQYALLVKKRAARLWRRWRRSRRPARRTHRGTQARVG